MSHKYEPSWGLLRITAEQLFSNRELYRSVQLSVNLTTRLSRSVKGLDAVSRTALDALILYEKLFNLKNFWQ